MDGLNSAEKDSGVRPSIKEEPEGLSKTVTGHHRLSTKPTRNVKSKRGKKPTGALPSVGKRGPILKNPIVAGLKRDVAKE